MYKLRQEGKIEDRHSFYIESPQEEVAYLYLLLRPPPVGDAILLYCNHCNACSSRVSVPERVAGAVLPGPRPQSGARVRG